MSDKPMPQCLIDIEAKVIEANGAQSLICDKEYVCADRKWATLDGQFTVEQVKAIANWMGEGPASASAWRSIESVPRDGSVVLLWQKNHPLQSLWVCRWHVADQRWVQQNDDRTVYVDPSLWAPLVPPEM